MFWIKVGFGVLLDFAVVAFVLILLLRACTGLH